MPDMNHAASEIRVYAETPEQTVIVFNWDIELD